MRIGLDFDNTIIRYDEVFQRAAKARGLIAGDFSGTKQQVRDAIRLQPEGETKWQALQGYVYGRGIGEAKLFPGVSEFLRRARRNGDTVLIVSHKTEYGHFDRDKVNLRSAALRWMEIQGFFSEDGFSIARDDVYFASTRSEKVSRIANLNCDFFVDDLEEVLSDPGFPPSVRRIFLSASAVVGHLPCKVCPDWTAIEEVIFLDH
jgi:hypothetical protein